jgi:hypothetical protein
VARDPGAAKRWRSREVALVLPIARARAMWHRARRFDLEAGGRFDRRGAAVLVWSEPFDAGTGDRTAPVGAFYVRWHAPAEDQATIWRLEWDEAPGGSEAGVRRAIAVLGGPRV